MDTLVCNKCELRYNLTSRQPIILNCGDTICQQCVYDGVMPQDQSKFICPFDQEEHYITGKPIYNRAIVKLIESQEKTKKCVIYCKEHPKKECDYYCDHESHNAQNNTYGLMICSDCIFNHTSHSQSLKKIEWFKLEQEMSAYQYNLDQLCNQVSQIKNWITQFLAQDQFYYQEDLESKIKLANYFNLMFLNQSKAGVFQNDVKEEKKANYYKKDFFDDSEIAKTKEDQEYLASIFKNKTKTKLLYRGTRDLFLAKNFHKLCDNQSPTVTLVKSSLGQTFGGYTQLPWKSADQDNTQWDSSAFIFSISKKTIHNPKPFNQIQSATPYNINNNKNYLPIFCGGFGISSIDQQTGYCNIGISNLGNIYESVPGEKQSQMGSDYLAGASRFNVHELEVYLIS